MSVRPVALVLSVFVLTLASSSCAELGGQSLVLFEVSVQAELIVLSLDSAPTVVEVTTVDGFPSTDAIFCTDDGVTVGRMALAEEYAPLDPLDPPLTLQGGGAFPGCYRDIEVILQIRVALPEQGPCPLPSGPADQSDLLQIELGAVLAERTVTVPMESTQCIQRAVESYGTPLLGPADLPRWLKFELTEADFLSGSESQ